jgi:hypothetical protein
MGRAAVGACGRSREHNGRDVGHAGSTSATGKTQPDCGDAQGRPARLHGRRPRNRLAAAVIAQGRESGHPAGPARLLSGCRNPNNISRIARKLSERLAIVDPANTSNYESRLQDFEHRWEEAIYAWELRGEQLRGLRLASHHRSFSYLADWLDLDIVATLESKPGIPPSAAHLAELLERLSPNPPAAVIRTPYSNEKPSIWLSERLKVPAVLLPYTVHDSDGPTDLFELIDSTLTILEELSQ